MDLIPLDGLILALAAAAFAAGFACADWRRGASWKWQLIQRLGALERRLHIVGGAMAISLDDLRTEVERNTAVDTSAVALLEGLAGKIQELIDAAGSAVDPAELQALVDALRLSTDGLSAAVAANTPGA